MTTHQAVSLLYAGSGNLDTPVNSAKWEWQFYFATTLAATTFTYSVYCADKTEPEPIPAALPR